MVCFDCQKMMRFKEKHDGLLFAWWKIAGWLVSVPCWGVGDYTKGADNGLSVIKLGWFQLVDVLNKWHLWSLFGSFESCILRSEKNRKLWCNPLWNATSLPSWDSNWDINSCSYESVIYPSPKWWWIGAVEASKIAKNGWCMGIEARNPNGSDDPRMRHENKKSSADSFRDWPLEISIPDPPSRVNCNPLYDPNLWIDSILRTPNEHVLFWNTQASTRPLPQQCFSPLLSTFLHFLSVPHWVSSTRSKKIKTWAMFKSVQKTQDTNRHVGDPRPLLPLWKKWWKTQLPLCSPDNFDQVWCLVHLRLARLLLPLLEKWNQCSISSPLGPARTANFEKSVLERLTVVWFGMGSYSLFMESFRERQFTKQKT